MKKLTLLELDYQQNSGNYFERFIDLPFPCLLDSCAASYKAGHSRYDIMTAAPSITIVTDAKGKTNLRHWHKKTRQASDNTTDNRVSNKAPFALLSELLKNMSPVANKDLPFIGGILGYWSYELCEQLEPEKIIPRNTGNPLMEVGLYHWALITDHRLRKSQLVFHPDISSELKQLILDALDKQPGIKGSFQLDGNFRPTQSKLQYQQAFHQIQDYIAAGDCYEVNLTQEFSANYAGDAWHAYKQLRTVSPAPYSAFIKTPSVNILSHSPERFIRIRNRQVETHPIKGTRPRGLTPEQDKANAEELLRSQKDRSENLMIVDLMRNDLGRVCETGSIRVPRLFALESYANVHHLVSTVAGTLPEESDAFDMLANTFPGGSITGAPKIRSMEIIRELEPAARSVYCGSIGYASCCGNMDTSITIRTMVAFDDRIHCWGGGAIVADSDCEEEYQESVTKVKNLMNTLEKAFQPQQG